MTQFHDLTMNSITGEAGQILDASKAKRCLIVNLASR